MEIKSMSELELMTIWGLRDCARKLGHQSPAANKKQELIDYIVNRQNETEKNPAENQADKDWLKRAQHKEMQPEATYDKENQNNNGANANDEERKHSPKSDAMHGDTHSAKTQPVIISNPMSHTHRTIGAASKVAGQPLIRPDVSVNSSVAQKEMHTVLNQQKTTQVANNITPRKSNIADNKQHQRLITSRPQFESHRSSQSNGTGNDSRFQYDRQSNDNRFDNRSQGGSYDSHSSSERQFQSMNNGNHQSMDMASMQQFESRMPEDLEITEVRSGVLEICPDGFGFLRAENYEQGDKDAYISAPKIRKSALKRGDFVVAVVKKLAENRPWNVVDIESINGLDPLRVLNRNNFDSLTPVYPDERFRLEIADQKNDFAIRAIDLVAPIGKGQRAMIVSPPKAGKTTLLKKIANSISINYPKAHLIVLLIDERPEEVTDMKRSINGEVVYSTFDEMPEHHIKASEMVLERAKRLTELGMDVVILMDSLTRLARAYNLVITPTGKTLSGGIDPGALHNPKRFFGAARNIENGGSLTIIATALVDTGSRMDDVIYEEFKGTGNMEIHLDRKLSEKRIFPAIDLNRSGTRREELLLDQKELEGIWAVRKMLSAGDPQESTENLIAMLVKSACNRDFIEQLSLQLIKLQSQGFNFRT
ncbi:MAG: transcription termination factor Rho [Christensenellaceae bacterium]|jgi:transcription termination factor Rho|nr:transcription termination factor Rho [Christensenellaceae bacterium]